MLLLWKIRVRKSGTCIYQTFEDAWEDWKSHDGELRVIYPILMSQKKFISLPEHNGW